MNRDQQFLLPPDMREWVPPTHPVWTVIEIVDYLQCAMVVRDACLAVYDEKDRRRQETTRGAVEIQR